MTRRTWKAGPWLLPLLFVLAPSWAAAAGPPPSPADIVSVAITPPVHTSVLIAEWDWHEFARYWKKQFGKTSGVVGGVTLVAILAVLIIMSKGRTPGSA